jgi:hypothetical protein
MYQSSEQRGAGNAEGTGNLTESLGNGFHSAMILWRFSVGR